MCVREGWREGEGKRRERGKKRERRGKRENMAAPIRSKKGKLHL